MWCIVVIAIAYICFKKWCKESLLYKIALYFQFFVVVDFIIICYYLPIKYKARIMDRFYYDCTYLVLLIILFFMVNKLLTALEEDKNGDTT